MTSKEPAPYVGDLLAQQTVVAPDSNPLTQDKERMIPIPKPAEYNRDEYVSLFDDGKREGAERE